MAGLTDDGGDGLDAVVALGERLDHRVWERNHLADAVLLALLVR